MKIIVPLSISPEDSVLKAWKEWDKGRPIFRYKAEDGFGSGVASRFELAEDFSYEDVEDYAKKLESDFNKFYSGFKFGMRQST